MRPFSYSRTNASRTARDSPGSSVNRARVQSQLTPARFICSTIFPPYFSFHSQTRSSNFSRPRSCRVRFSVASCFSTMICVAIPAWSIPGTHSVTFPHILCQRTWASMIECSNIWPMCSEPVTFGGGITNEKYGVPGGGASTWKRLDSTHHLAQCGSNRWGSYTFSISMGKLNFNSKALHYGHELLRSKRLGRRFSNGAQEYDHHRRGDPGGALRL